MAHEQTPVKIIECPRDAMQGWERFIATEEKIRYLNALLEVGFDTLDFGSFVSPKAIPQMADTAGVLRKLRYGASATKLLAIVVNVQGAREAVGWEGIDYLGYPFSISETFQLRNAHSTITDSFDAVKEIQELCVKYGKELVLYISMGFGNPYGDPYDKDIVIGWVDQMIASDIHTISLADTVGIADPDIISYLFSHIIPVFPEVEFGAHFHSLPQTRIEKLEAAYDSGCRRFDVAIGGIGGCPMAEDELVGNMATETLLHFLGKRNIPATIDAGALLKAQDIAAEIFR